MILATVISLLTPYFNFSYWILDQSQLNYILQCWNGKDAGRYTNSIVNDGLHHQEYNPEVPIDLSRYPQDAQINQQIRALRSITQKIENAHKGLDVDWPVEGQHGNGNFH